MKGLILVALVVLGLDMPWFIVQALAQRGAQSNKESEIRKGRLIMELKWPQKSNERDDAFKPISAAFSSDGNYIAAGERTSGINFYSGPQIMIWESKTGKLLHQLRARSLLKESGQIHVLSFSPDSKHLLSSGIDGALRLWNVQTGKNDLTIKPPRTDLYYDAIFCPEGHAIASVNQDCVISIWDARTAKKTDEWTIPGKHFQDQTSLAFSPDGKILVSSSQGGLYFWNLQDHRLIRHVPSPVNSNYPESLEPIVFTDRGNSLIGYSDYSTHEIDHEIIKFAADTGKVVARLRNGKSPYERIAFSHDGKVGLSSTSDENFDTTDLLAVWDLASGKKRYRFKIPFKTQYCLALSSDGSTALVANEVGPILIYQLPP